MNRGDFQQLAELRIREAKALLAAGFPDGAYYLGGYSVECGLKACIAKRTLQHDFPDKKLVDKSYSHDLEKLLEAAELTRDLQLEIRQNPQIQIDWALVTEWSEQSRYTLAKDNLRSASEALGIEGADSFKVARRLIDSVESPTGGILPWIRQRW